MLDVECKLASGLDYLPKEVNCCCILGMGGNTIYEILKNRENDLLQFDAIIIEPQSNFSLPIEYLLNHGFYNDCGIYLYEKRYYPLMRFIKGKQENTPLEIKYGPYMVKNQDEMLASMLKKELKLLSPYKHVLETEIKYLEIEKEYKEIFDEA